MDSGYMRRAIQLSREAQGTTDCGPFGCVIVRRGMIVGEGFNQVVRRHDPTAHAEIMAIREACTRLGTHDLSDCELYASCRPCPMCMGAILWARLPAVHFGASSEDAERAGFDDAAFYGEMQNAEGRLAIDQCLREEAADALAEWHALPMRACY